MCSEATNVSLEPTAAHTCRTFNMRSATQKSAILYVRDFLALFILHYLCRIYAIISINIILSSSISTIANSVVLPFCSTQPQLLGVHDWIYPANVVLLPVKYRYLRFLFGSFIGDWQWQINPYYSI